MLCVPHESTEMQRHLSYIVDGATARQHLKGLKGLKVSSCAFSYLIFCVSDLFDHSKPTESVNIET